MLSNYDRLGLAAKMETLRSDQRGSVTLLAGMMVFVATMFGIIAMDTNMAIHNRIVAQNAVDSAADSAALWQARFCNLEQLLNNLHYTVDEVACIVEGVDDVACVASVVFAVLKYVPFCEEAAVAQDVSCVVCDTLPAVDKLQHLFYDAIIPVQEGIADAAPFVVFGYANANAYGSGANSVLAVASEWIGGVGSKITGLIPGAGSISSSISSMGSAFGDLSVIPIYTFPLDPTRLELDVKTNQASGPPEVWDKAIPLVGAVAGMIGCEDNEGIEFPDACSDVEYEDDGVGGDSDRQDNNDDNKPAWGWNDLYMKGNPGFMTWIAGVTNRDELLHLGGLAWLNGGMKNSDYKQNEEQVSQLMWNGNAIGNSGGYSKFQIPAFIAIASSQIEGHPVICNGDADAKPYLITVTLPFPSDNTNSAKSYFIFH
jgi:hypothetical protein